MLPHPNVCRQRQTKLSTCVDRGRPGNFVDEIGETARQNRPELVLLDIGMPKLNGYEAAIRLRASAEGKSLVLVAVTGWGLDADKRRAHEVGFDLHFVKPASVLALKRLIVNPARLAPIADA